MSSPVSVSVIVPAYNQARFLGCALRSLVEQTHVDWEAIVVDDGSTDNPQAVVQDFHEPRIRFAHQENRGLAAARNTGLRQADGQSTRSR